MTVTDEIAPPLGEPGAAGRPIAVAAETMVDYASAVAVIRIRYRKRSTRRLTFPFLRQYCPVEHPGPAARRCLHSRR